MSFTAVFKSALLGAVFMVLAFFWMVFVAELPPARLADGTPMRPSFAVFEVAVYAWVALAGWTGALLGMTHAGPQAAAARRRNFLGSVELLFWTWLVFFFVHLAGLPAVPLHGIGVLTAASFMVSAALVGFWMYARSRATSTDVQDPVISEPKVGWSA